MIQKYDSRLTSVNSKQMPKTIKFVEHIIEKTQIWLDIGGGRFNNAIDFFQQLNAKLLVLDPYNRPPLHNEQIENFLINNEVDGVMCNNVLNVIEEPEIRTQIIQKAFSSLKNNGNAYFLVYEGDGSAIGKITKKSKDSTSFQMNQKKEFYLNEIKAVFGDNISIKNSIIIAHKKNEPTPQSSIQQLQRQANTLGIKRYGDVGKSIGGNLYIHKQYSNILEQKSFQQATNTLKNFDPNFQYNIVKHNTKNNSYSFISCTNFDTQEEPTVGKCINVNNKQEVKIIQEKQDPQIYHHKWLFVKDDYQGFDVEQSIKRSLEWKTILGRNTSISSKIGFLSFWQQWCRENIHNFKPKNNKIK